MRPETIFLSIFNHIGQGKRKEPEEENAKKEDAWDENCATLVKHKTQKNAPVCQKTEAFFGFIGWLKYLRARIRP